MKAEQKERVEQIKELIIPANIHSGISPGGAKAKK